MARAPYDPSKCVVKRVIALPGETVQVRPPPSDPHNTQQIEKRAEVVPEGHVWLEGDNATNSKDSRHYGAVPQALVNGKVSLRLYPLSTVGCLPPRIQVPMSSPPPPESSSQVVDL
ncbi:unnamed protein product [Choristocarpus tenellus]